MTKEKPTLPVPHGIPLIDVNSYSKDYISIFGLKYEHFEIQVEINEL